jgi:hypothetical protein
MNINKINCLKGCGLFLFIGLLHGLTQADAGNLHHTENNTLSYRETAISGKHYSDTLPGNLKDWEILFDGKNTDKWRGTNDESFPSDAWTVEDGSLFVKDHTTGKDIITRDKYSNFELVFDFKLTNAANSGIKYFVDKIRNNKSGDMVWNGPEYQIIDDYNNPAVKGHKHDVGSTASYYLVYAPKNKHLKPAGQWNHGKIIAIGNHVEHWLNGVKVVSYERGSADCRQRISATKFNNYDHYGELPSGHIMLTDHDGDKVYFRNIKIRRIE